MLRGIDGWQEVEQIFYTFAFADVSDAVHKVFNLFVATFWSHDCRSGRRSFCDPRTFLSCNWTVCCLCFCVFVLPALQMWSICFPTALALWTAPSSKCMTIWTKRSTMDCLQSSPTQCKKERVLFFDLFHLWMMHRLQSYLVVNVRIDTARLKHENRYICIFQYWCFDWTLESWTTTRFHQ